MLEYKIYRLDQRGKISTPPEIVTSDQELAVVEKARSMAEGCDIEVWQGERLVIHVPDSECGRESAPLRGK